MELNRRRHMMYALAEVDVTSCRAAVRAYRARTGSPLSLTGFLIYCLARAVDEDKAMHAYRLGRRRLVHFAEVDLGIMVERDVHGLKMPMPTVLRAANTKTLSQIQQELQRAQDDDPDTVAVRTLPRWLRPQVGRLLSSWLLLPGAARRLVWQWAVRDPFRRKRLTGTVGFTAMSMFGRGAGWGVAPMAHTLTLIVGGVSNRPVLAAEHIETRDYLCLTLAMDHDVIDGAPAARFIKRLTRLIESGAGLSEPAGDPEPRTAVST